jgi:methionyl-tRNA formyltransferase
MKLQASAVKVEALARGLPVLQPRGLRLDGRYAEDAVAAQAVLAQARLDVLVVAAYGLILPQWALTCATHGALNIHASLLPRWRGAAPIQRALEAGDAETGITLMQMDAGLDTGPMLLARRLPIGAGDNAAVLHDRLAVLGAQLVVEGLPPWVSGRLPAKPQPTEGITYAAKIEKAEAAIDWRWPAALIERRVRAFDPFPGASFTLDGQAVKLWRARVEETPAETRAPGTCLRPAPGRLLVACGEGVLELLEVQRTGGRRVAVADFLRGQPLTDGARLPPPHRN